MPKREPTFAYDTLEIALSHNRKIVLKTTVSATVSATISFNWMLPLKNLEITI